MIPLTVERNPPKPPPGWRWELLTDLARLESGHTPSRRHPEWWGGELPWLALPDIRAVDCAVIYDTGETVNEAGIANSSARLLPELTVALSRTASVGFVTILGRPMATSQDFVCWVSGPQLRPRFLMHLLHASRDYIRSLASGAIHKTVYVPTVKAFRVCVPLLQEQDRFVAELDEQLDAAERMRAAADSTAQRIECLAAAALERSLLSCTSGTNRAPKKLEDVALVTGGIQKSPARAPQSFHRPFLTVRNVRRGHLDLSSVEHMEVTPAELKRLVLRSGDLLIVEGNGSRDQIGRNALFRAEIAECVHQNHLIRVRVDTSRLRPEYLSLYLNSRDGMSQMIQRAKSTTGLYTLSVRKIQSLEVPVPNPSTQDAMIHAWRLRRNAIERGWTAATSQAAAAEMLPAALLRQAFANGLGDGDD